MENLEDYIVDGALLQGETGPEAQVGDEVKLYLDQESNPAFPEFILGIIQHPITKVSCETQTSYVISYNPDDLLGAAALLHPDDVLSASITSNLELLAEQIDEVASNVNIVAGDLETETAARIAADSGLQTQIDDLVSGGDGIAAVIHAAVSKITPVNADELGIADSAAAWGLKKLTWSNLKATLKAYFDALYPSGSGSSTGTNTGDQTSIVGITGTKVQFNAALSDANFAWIGTSNTFTEAQTFADIVHMSDFDFGQGDGNIINANTLHAETIAESYNFHILEEGTLTFYSTVERDAARNALFAAPEFSRHDVNLFGLTEYTLNVQAYRDYFLVIYGPVDIVVPYPSVPVTVIFYLQSGAVAPTFSPDGDDVPIVFKDGGVVFPTTPGQSYVVRLTPSQGCWLAEVSAAFTPPVIDP